MTDEQKECERIARHLQGALTEVIACLPGKVRTVSVGAREFDADDVRRLCQQKKIMESALEAVARVGNNTYASEMHMHTARGLASDALRKAKEYD
jgi:hypothetical protein